MNTILSYICHSWPKNLRIEILMLLTKIFFHCYKDCTNVNYISKKMIQNFSIHIENDNLWKFPIKLNIIGIALMKDYIDIEINYVDYSKKRKNQLAKNLTLNYIKMGSIQYLIDCCFIWSIAPININESMILLKLLTMMNNNLYTINSINRIISHIKIILIYKPEQEPSDFKYWYKFLKN